MGDFVHFTSFGPQKYQLHRRLAACQALLLRWRQDGGAWQNRDVNSWHNSGITRPPTRPGLVWGCQVFGSRITEVLKAERLKRVPWKAREGGAVLSANVSFLYARSTIQQRPLRRAGRPGQGV